MDAVHAAHPLKLIGVFQSLGHALPRRHSGADALHAEYGTARWGTQADIAPFIAPKFEDNIILTQTERLTMNSRPKDPKTARNKNMLVIGGSGSVICSLYERQ